MQNFTFGRKGTNWFLFAFVLLIGTLPSFGQECPTVDDNQQFFCDSQDAEVANLEATAAEDSDVAWYESEDATEPLSATTLLTNGTYYAGTSDQNCGIAVEVTVYTAPEILGVTEGTRQQENNNKQSLGSLTICVSDEDNPDVTVGELRTSADDGDGTVNWYLEGSNEPLDPDTPLQDNTYYEVSQTVPGDACETNRNRTLVQLDSEDAPEVVPEQVFCATDEPVLADIEATGENRYYANATTNARLSANEPLVDGSTYWVSRLGETCESTERRPVTVELQEANAGEDNSLTLCQSELQSRLDGGESAEDIFLSLLDEGVATDGTFDPSISELESQYANNPYDTFETTYTVTNDEGCEDSAELALTVLEDPNAGDDIEEEICSSELDNPAALIAEFSSYLEGRDDDGTFDDLDTPEVETYNLQELGNNLFSRFQNDPYQSFSFSYDVENEAGCSDSAEISFTVNPSPDAGSDNSTSYCNTEIPALVQEIPEDVAELYFELLADGVPTDGTFNPSIEEIIESYNENNFQNFSTTYTITNEFGCSDSVNLTITIEEPTEANAGEISDQTICSGEDVLDLITLLSPEATTGGTFSGEGVNEGYFDPVQAGVGEYEITYTVAGDDEECISGEASTNFTITVIQGADAGPDNATAYCNTEIPALVQEIPEDVAALYFELLADGVPTDGTFNPSIEEIIESYNENNFQDFTTTYTVGDNGCQDSAELTITVNEPVDANAGEDVTLTFCTTDEDQDLFAFLSEDATTGGTFEDLEDGNFSPSEAGAGEYTFTYTVDDSADCIVTGTEDSATFTVEVLEGANAGEDNSITYCSTEIDELVQDIPEDIEQLYFDLLTEGVPTDGTFDPSIEEIIESYENNNFQDFTTIYTVGEGECEDSVELTITVTEPVDANAGEDVIVTFCTTDEDQDLSVFLSEEATTGGTFEGLEDGIFSPSEAGAGEYTFTYTVDDSADCIVTETEDSATFTVEVFEGVNAGGDVNVQFCITEVEELIQNPDDAIEFFTSLLGEDVDPDGTFSPSLEDLAVQYIQNPIDTFETTYSVSNEECEDSAEISVTINEQVDADAGEFDDLVFCSTDEDVNLNDFVGDNAIQGGSFTIDGEEIDNGIFSPSMMNPNTYTVTYTVDESMDCVEGEDSTTFEIVVLQGADAGSDNNTAVCNDNIEGGMFPDSTSVRDFYLNLLDEGVSRSGTFNPSIQELMDRYNNGDEIGDFTTTYTLGEGECSDSVELTVTVIEGEEANAGEIDDITVCSSDDDLDLYTLLSGDAHQDGTFEGYEDGIFSPSTQGAGEFEITYTVDENSACVEGEASTTFTVEVLQGADAGEDMEVTFCTNEGVQDLYTHLSANAELDGEFTDEDGEAIEDGLFDPSAYDVGTHEFTYTVTANEEQCGEDDEAVLTVTLTDTPEAPTGTDATFCAIEGATAAQLQAEGENLTWYTDAELTTMLGEDDLLEDGEYFVTQTPEGGCESDADVVNVTINDSPAPGISQTTFEFCEIDDATIAELDDEITDSGEITWYDSEDGNNALGTSTPLSTGTYYATLTDPETGCESSERLTVSVTVEDCPIVYPEGISPNGDGRNDTFIIENIENEYPNYSIEIFNRWGNVIYRGNASIPEWDGTSNQSGAMGDDVLPVGVYFYVIDFNDGSTEPRQGKVYLSR